MRKLKYVVLFVLVTAVGAILIATNLSDGILSQPEKKETNAEKTEKIEKTGWMPVKKADDPTPTKKDDKAEKKDKPTKKDDKVKAKPADTSKLVLAEQAGDDVIVTLPKGMSYERLNSRYISFVKPKVVEKKDGKLLVRANNLKLKPKFVTENGDKVTFRLSGTISKTLEIGLPEGYTGEVRKKD